MAVKSQRRHGGNLSEISPFEKAAAAAAAAKSLQSCPTLCDPIRRQPTRLPHPWDSPGKNTGVGCHFLLQCIKVKVKSLSHVRLLATPWTGAYQAPPSMGFSRQEYWSGVPLPSPNAHSTMHAISGCVVVQSLSCVQFFVTSWTAAGQASLSFTIS